MKGFFLKIKPFICIFQSFQKHRLILVVHFFCPFNPRTIMWPFRNVWRKCRVKMRVTVLHRDCEFLACFLAQGEQSDHGPKSVSRQLIGQACWLQALLSYCWHNWKQLLFQKYSSCRNCLSKKAWNPFTCSICWHHVHFSTAVENGRGKGFIFDLQCCTITLALTANKRKSKTSERNPKKDTSACHFICFD